MTALLQAHDLTVSFPAGGGWLRPTRHVQAVRAVNLELHAGEALAVVGESGSGKTTLARALLGLVPIASGQVYFAGQDMAGMTDAARQAMRRQVQMVFQDPFGSLDPRLSVGGIIAEPLDIHAIGTTATRRARVAELLELVGLPGDAAARYPHQFSGGQRQRIALARALAPAPQVIIADEPLSALDVSIQSQILNLLVDLRARIGLAYLIISHDLAAVHHLADRVATMYLGGIVEVAGVEAMFTHPAHPYTAGLLAAVPRLGVGKRVPGGALPGDIPSPLAPPSGCVFHPRCDRASARCGRDVPVLRALNADRAVACHHPLVEEI